jgi:replication factor C large subunit
LWSEKYRPDTIEDMVGNDDARGKFLGWLKKWKSGSKAAILVGPPGTGKTTSVHLAAKTLGLNLIELNASDSRTRERLSKKLGEAVSSTNLFGDRSIIFLDEVDGLAGRADYGAVDFIKDAIKNSENPVVMAANDPDSDQVRKMGSSTVKIQFVRPEPEVVEKRLEMIARKEGLDAAKPELEDIVKAANGDIRAAINFLQSGIPARKDEELTATQAVNGFFSAANEKEALAALRAYPGQPRDKLRDIFTAVLRSRLHEERKAVALDALSRADVLMGRMIRGRDWRLLRYLDPMLASELWRSMGDGGPKYATDAVPWLLQLRIWNDSRKLRDIASIAAGRVWISRRGFLVEDMPFLLVLSHDKVFRDELVASLDLEENYEAFLSKEGSRWDVS